MENRFVNTQFEGDDDLPEEGFMFSAVPPKFKGVGWKQHGVGATSFDFAQDVAPTPHSMTLL